jgi:hypothetical protein
MPTPQKINAYNTLEDIQQRKEELRTDIQLESRQMGDLWHDLTQPQEATSKGELIANLVANSITAIDAFLLVRKLMKTYGAFFRRKRK